MVDGQLLIEESEYQQEITVTRGETIPAKLSREREGDTNVYSARSDVHILSVSLHSSYCRALTIFIIYMRVSNL